MIDQQLHDALNATTCHSPYSNADADRLFFYQWLRLWKFQIGRRFAEPLPMFSNKWGQNAVALIGRKAVDVLLQNGCALLRRPRKQVFWKFGK
ncbi:MAG: hypothetical protein LBH53_03280 [Puniceicoccales bacterium]|nr:hypothetical protein [Puniceicoccales bacterium]